MAHCLRCCTACACGCRWYGRYRAAKRRGYAAARAQYVARLRRQGAVRWLEAGGVARQQRLQLLAAEQVWAGVWQALSTGPEVPVLCSPLRLAFRGAIPCSTALLRDHRVVSICGDKLNWKTWSYCAALKHVEVMRMCNMCK